MITKLKSTGYHLLRKSEKYTKTDMVYLASGGFWLGLGQTATSLSTIALAVAFANLIPQETYGTYKYILSIAGLFAVFTLPEVGTAFARAISKDGRIPFYPVTAARIRFAILGSFFATAGSIYYALSHNIELALALLIIAVTLPLFDTFTLHINYFAGTRRFDLQTKYYALTQAISVGALIIALFLTHSVLIILLAYFLPLAAVRFILYRLTARSIPQDSNSGEVKEIIQYGKHLTLMSIPGIVAAQADKFLLWHFLGPIHVAVYAFALAIPEQLKGPLKGIGELAFPKFAVQTAEQIHANLPSLFRKIGLYAAVLVAISLLYILFAPIIFSLVLPQYMESVVYSQIFSLSLVTSVSSVLLAVLVAQKKTRVQYVISLAQPAVAIFLFITLIPSFGILGAIGAYVASRFAMLAMLATAVAVSVK